MRRRAPAVAASVDPSPVDDPSPLKQREIRRTGVRSPINQAEEIRERRCVTSANVTTQPPAGEAPNAIVSPARACDHRDGGLLING